MRRDGLESRFYDGVDRKVNLLCVLHEDTYDDCFCLAQFNKQIKEVRSKHSTANHCNKQLLSESGLIISKHCASVVSSQREDKNENTNQTKKK